MIIPDIKKLILLNLSLIISFGVNGQEIGLFPNWNAGESHTYLISENMKHEAMGKTRVQSQSSKEISIAVTNKSIKILNIEWTIKKIEYVDSVKSELPDIGINRIAEGLVVKYTIGTDDDHFELLNFRQLKDSIASRLNKNISNLATEMNVSEDKLAMMRTQFLMMYSTRPAIDAIVLPDIYKFHQLYGRKYIVSTSQTFDRKPVDKTMGSPDQVEIILVNINDKTSSFNVKVISPFAEIMGWSKSSNSSYVFSINDNWLDNHKSIFLVEGKSSMLSIYEIQKVN